MLIEFTKFSAAIVDPLIPRKLMQSEDVYKRLLRTEGYICNFMKNIFKN